ncbi:MAG: hypothetical protein UY44_C0010G0016 [Candidatus Kaiserbacteria bacterium GW2011_GWA2_49_19]|uniref:Uncharacterized protein n=2 Tax=Candidatus Kaiseribacteriota TaxID=1752734 RepID=A0A0G1YQ44_9BACT|nr:MAG: hypothetical protein UY44_C0010G0016 [Candidatus Kaiserbacteria bacterium GW2011_GWA2_49_19]OGG60914.1 MAG: hypothetical protein A3C86_03430 [Candidatus Kaiserbacteria bacterium RIFCSPHIGHO2_02_FULL_49_16]
MRDFPRNQAKQLDPKLKRQDFVIHAIDQKIEKDDGDRDAYMNKNHPYVPVTAESLVKEAKAAVKLPGVDAREIRKRRREEQDEQNRRLQDSGN